ncbi:MAG TPA: ammonium transporter [Chitinispirillaceae bacterium]|nr:ammonium transporter [Chitinispirillaceae bacterium]
MRIKNLKITATVIAMSAVAVLAAEPASSEHLKISVDTVWTLIAAFLVFFMQAGFAMVESGFTRAKNASNIMMKNLMDFSIGSIVYWVLGFGLMFGTSMFGLFGKDSFFLVDGVPGTNDWAFAFFIFQTVFAATSATIVSGAMAERTKFISYLVYTAVISAFIYPVFGHWAWGSLFGKTKGWLETLGFIDFAGSTVVHSIGGWAALAGAIVLGPRLGKYTTDGRAKAIPGHNIPIATLGVFILWFGWFGFNPGSTTAGTNLSIGRIAVTTNLAAAAGAFTALFASWILLKKPDPSMTLNGVLAGLVAITSPCAVVSPLSSVIIGAVAGVLVVFAVLFIDKVLKIDDPVGAISVHGICGAFGTLCAGLFAESSYSGGVNGLLFGGGFSQFGIQVTGVLTAFAWSFGLSMILFLLIKATIGIRVTAEEEIQGLDIGEHGMEAYHGFQIFTTEDVGTSPLVVVKPKITNGKQKVTA